MREIFFRSEFDFVLSVRDALGASAEAASAAESAARSCETATRNAQSALRSMGEGIEAMDTATRTAQQVVRDADKFARIDRSNTFIGSHTVSGSLTVYGDLAINGEQYVVHAEEVRSAKDHIVMRDGAVGGLGAHQYSGFEIVKYNGADTCLLAVNAAGEVRVGDYGMGLDDTQPLLTRTETTDLRDGDLLRWDAQRMCAVPLRMQPIDLVATFEDDPENPVTYWLVSLPGYVPPANTNA